MLVLGWQNELSPTGQPTSPC